MYSGVNKIYTRKLIIPNNITCVLKEKTCTFKNMKDQEITTAINNKVNIIIEENTINISAKTINEKSIINTTYIIFKNNIKGLLNNFEKTLILKGVGYKAEYKDKILKLSLGFSHPIQFNIPNDIEIILNTPTSICIKGISKYKVGQIAHNIKAKRPIEIYKGNGIKYKDEIIKLKSAKKTK